MSGPLALLVPGEASRAVQLHMCIYITHNSLADPLRPHQRARFRPRPSAGVGRSRPRRPRGRNASRFGLVRNSYPTPCHECLDRSSQGCKANRKIASASRGLMRPGPATFGCEVPIKTCSLRSDPREAIARLFVICANLLRFAAQSRYSNLRANANRHQQDVPMAGHWRRPTLACLNLDWKNLIEVPVACWWR